MAIQFSVNVRNGRLDAIETVISTAPILKIRTGSPPANCAASRTGTVLASITLPSDWMNNASSGQKTKLGTWTDASADNGGTAGHFEVMDSTDTTCHIQGTVTATGGGGDMTVDSVTFVAGQPFEVTTFTLTDGNA
jgi:hypothetical protein